MLWNAANCRTRLASKSVESPAMNPSPSVAQTGHSHLRRLVLLRCIAVAVQCATLALVYRFLEMDLRWLPMLVTVGALVALNLLTWLRLRNNSPVSNMELFAQLCADVLALSVLLYYGGGSANPFISLFLLPLVIAAATLPRAYTWTMAAITTGCYSVLMKFYVPLPEVYRHVGHEGHLQHVRPQDEIFNMHIIGMWAGFGISTIVVAYFVVKMAYAVRERDQALTKMREETLRNERIVALGTQAAGAAHELGTPLSTLAVVIGELQREQAILPEWRDNLSVLDDQVRACKRILGTLLANAQETGTHSMQSLQDFLAATLDEWQLLRPEVQYRYQLSTAQPVPQLRTEPALRAALLNLLNNAADASPQGIEIQAEWNEDRITLQIHDCGPGLTPGVAARAGSAFFTTKQEGHGLGLFLANATVERMGGSVRLFNREGGGATTQIVLPVS